MNKQYVYFKELPTNTRFSLNGNVYFKRSTRTAEIVEPGAYKGSWFYFTDRTLCIVGEHSRLGGTFG